MQRSPIGPVTVSSFPGRIAVVTPNNSTRFAPSVIIIGPGNAVCIAAIGEAAILWTNTAENFICPGLYVGVNSTSTTATDIKRCQIGEGE